MPAVLAELANKGFVLADVDCMVPTNSCTCHVLSHCGTAVLLLSFAPAVELCIPGDDMWTSPATRNQLLDAARYLHRLRL